MLAQRQEREREVRARNVAKMKRDQEKGLHLREVQGRSENQNQKPTETIQHHPKRIRKKQQQRKKDLGQKK
jgi:hypothetical protein